MQRVNRDILLYLLLEIIELHIQEARVRIAPVAAVWGNFATQCPIFL
jgi:hypothetical protein